MYSQNILLFCVLLVGVINCVKDRWICKKAFADDIPAIYFDGQDLTDGCIPLRDYKTSNDVSCGLVPERQCLASRFLNDLNTPLYSAIHIENNQETLDHFNNNAGSIKRGWSNSAVFAGKRCI